MRFAPVGRRPKRGCAARDSAISIKLRAGIGSTKAEYGSLIVPSQRQTRLYQQFVCGQPARLAPLENGSRDVRGEIAEADKPREIGWADAFLLGQCGKRHAVAAGEGGIEPTRPDQQLDQPPVGFRCGKRISPDEHLISRPQRRSAERRLCTRLWETLTSLGSHPLRGLAKAPRRPRT